MTAFAITFATACFCDCLYHAFEAGVLLCHQRRHMQLWVLPTMNA